MSRVKDINPLFAPRRGGFTLLEMLAATALMGILTIAVFSSLEIGFKARATAQGRVEPVQQLALAMELVRNDLHAALPVTGDLVSKCIGEDSQDSNGHDQDSLLLFNGRPRTPWPDHPTGLRRVEFMLTVLSPGEAPTLVREIMDNILAPIEPEPEVEVLCPGVRSFNLRYYDGADWIDAWDSAARGGTLPRAGQLTIELRPRQEGQETLQPITGPRLTTIVTLPCGGEVSGEAGRVIR